MIKTLQIKIGESKKHTTYPIHIGENLLGQINKLIPLEKYSKIFIITDDNLKESLEKIEQSIGSKIYSIILPPGEKAKTIENVQKIWRAMHDAQLDRKSLALNLGGGVIGDMGGFAASTYIRGIDFINIPTTILAQVDESVGGKTGIGFAGIKNLVGTFQQPTAVIIDVATLKTLPKREFLSGFAEIIKHGLIADKKYFETVTSKHPLEFSKEELIEITARSCEIKRDVVENDPTENGLRKIVNFGHTIGHAIEALSLESDKHLLHGEAISIGMIAESKLSQLKKYISQEEMNVIKERLQNAGLPTSSNAFSPEDILQKIAHDKKIVSGKVQWTLLKTIGEASYNEDVAMDLVTQAIAFMENE